MEQKDKPKIATSQQIPYIAHFLFLTRWLQLPLYLGLVLAQCMYFISGSS